MLQVEQSSLSDYYDFLSAVSSPFPNPRPSGYTFRPSTHWVREWLHS